MYVTALIVYILSPCVQLWFTEWVSLQQWIWNVILSRYGKFQIAGGNYVLAHYSQQWYRRQQDVWCSRAREVYLILNIIFKVKLPFTFWFCCSVDNIPWSSTLQSVTTKSFTETPGPIVVLPPSPVGISVFFNSHLLQYFVKQTISMLLSVWE